MVRVSKANKLKTFYKTDYVDRPMSRKPGSRRAVETTARSRRGLTAAIVVIVTLAILGIIIGLDAFFDRYDLKFQSPIVIQSPVLVSDRTNPRHQISSIITPLAEANEGEQSERARPDKNLAEHDAPPADASGLTFNDTNYFPEGGE